MQLTLPEPLKSEAQALAQQQGVALETIVIQAVEYYLKSQSDIPTRTVQARQRLQELNRLKYKKSTDVVAEIRQIRSMAADLYLGQAEFEQSQLLQVAEKPADYHSDPNNPDEALP